MAGWRGDGRLGDAGALGFRPLIADLRTLETRQAIERVPLRAARAAALGLDVDRRWPCCAIVSMVAAGCAAAAAILGFHVLRRNRSARLGLTVLAVPLLPLRRWSPAVPGRRGRRRRS